MTYRSKPRSVGIPCGVESHRAFCMVTVNEKEKYGNPNFLDNIYTLIDGSR